jgi:hypothetical protein
MLKYVYTILALMIVTGAATAQKVANYSVSKYGTETYEHFSFWQKAGKRAEITYSRGKDAKASPVKYIGVTTYQGKKGFKIALPDKYLLSVIPVGNKLQIIAPGKSYNKAYEWEYEGPVNGVGTFCNVCAQNEKEAMQVIKTYFIK